MTSREPHRNFIFFPPPRPKELPARQNWPRLTEVTEFNRVTTPHAVFSTFSTLWQAANHTEILFFSRRRVRKNCQPNICATFRHFRYSINSDKFFSDRKGKKILTPPSYRTKNRKRTAKPFFAPFAGGLKFFYRSLPALQKIQNPCENSAKKFQARSYRDKNRKRTAKPFLPLSHRDWNFS